MVNSSLEFEGNKENQAEFLVMITTATLSPEMTWGKGMRGYWRWGVFWRLQTFDFKTLSAFI